MAALEDRLKMLPFTLGLVRHSVNDSTIRLTRVSRVGEFVGELFLTLLQKSEYGAAAIKTIENM